MKSKKLEKTIVSMLVVFLMGVPSAFAYREKTLNTTEQEQCTHGPYVESVADQETTIDAMNYNQSTTQIASKESKDITSSPSVEILYQVQAVPAQPEIVYVDDDYNESTPGWGYNHFKNIYPGINAVAEHGTVLVFNGTYNAGFYLTKSCKLIGENPETTVVYGFDSGHTTPAFWIYADGITISGFTFQFDTEYFIGWGLFALSSNNNIISGNIFMNNDYEGKVAIVIDGENNTIRENDFVDFSFSVHCYGERNLIYHNNFFDDGAWDVGINNLWDNGYPPGGNYWGDYIGSDNYSGPGQNASGSDGIGDTPYPIPGGNSQDYYPLMEPYYPSDYPVVNLDTGERFSTIQSAIDDNDTLDGHTIFVHIGIYYEHVTIRKAIILQGEERDTTIIDGNETGDVVKITTNGVTIHGFTMRNSGDAAYPNYDAGIDVRSKNNTISRNIIINNKYGIYLHWYCRDDIISENIFINNSKGMYSYSSDNDTVSKNIFTNNTLGIHIYWFSRGNTISENTITNNAKGIDLYWYSEETLINENIIMDNTIFGIRSLGSENSISQNTVSNSTNGIRIYGRRNNISKNTITNSINGIHLSSYASNLINQNTITDNINGIYSDGSHSVVNQNIISNNENGISLNGSDHLVIAENIITNNTNGIYSNFSLSKKGIIFNNIITNNERGISSDDDFNNNFILENLLTNNNKGIHLTNSDDNHIYHNNFIINNQHAYDEGNNTWDWDDGGYPDGGNYWDDFDEPSEGAYDNDSDGIVDSPYNIPGGNNQDRYPFMNPYGWMIPEDLEGNGDAEHGFIEISERSIIKEGVTSDRDLFPWFVHDFVLVDNTRVLPRGDPIVPYFNDGNYFTFDVVVTVGEMTGGGCDDWTCSGLDATISGPAEFFQNPAGSNVPPDPWRTAYFPGLEFDSYFGPHDNIGFAYEPINEPQYISAGWFDTINMGCDSYTIARFTVHWLGGGPATLTVEGDSAPASSGGALVHFGPFTVTIPQVPGDLDHDGDVDLSDLAQLLAHYGMTSGATYEMGDIDWDGDVDLADLGVLLGNYGTGT